MIVVLFMCFLMTGNIFLQNSSTSGLQTVSERQTLDIPLLSVMKSSNATSLVKEDTIVLRVSITNYGNFSARNVNCSDQSYPSWLFKVTGELWHFYKEIAVNQTVNYTVVLEAINAGNYTLPPSEVTYYNASGNTIYKAFSNSLKITVWSEEPEPPKDFTEKWYTIGIIMAITIIIPTVLLFFFEFKASGFKIKVRKRKR
ncbi:MAG: hypothetical protein ACFE68_05275 [Candidatus Hodarchaeota archaeon]